MSDTMHAFSYGDHVRVLAYRRTTPPAPPDPHLTEVCESAAEAVEHTLERLEMRQQQKRLHARRERQELRLMRQAASERGETTGILDYNASLDIEWRLIQERRAAELAAWCAMSYAERLAAYPGIDADALRADTPPT